LACTFPSYGQVNHQPDFIILNSGDTLFGKIKKPSLSYMIHHQVRFLLPDEKKHFRFGPAELQGFRVQDEVFESRYIWIGKFLEKKYLRVLVTGHCTLYQYRYANKPVRGKAPEPPVTSYYVARGIDRLHRLKWDDLRSGKDNYFSDDPYLMKDIEEGRYREDDITEIISRYNERKQINVKLD
jgi:hypothetical protein